MQGTAWAAMVEDMRDWLLDCDWADVDSEDIEAMPTSLILEAVKRHYRGGVAGFMRDCD